MTAGEAVAVAASLASVVALAVALVSTTRSLTAVRLGMDELRREHRETRDALDELRRSVRPVRVELEPVALAPEPNGDAGGAHRPVPRLASVALSDPVIKVVAAASGTARAARSFRRG